MKSPFSRVFFYTFLVYRPCYDLLVFSGRKIIQDTVYREKVQGDFAYEDIHALLLHRFQCHFQYQYHFLSIVQNFQVICQAEFHKTVLEFIQKLTFITKLLCGKRIFQTETYRHSPVKAVKKARQKWRLESVS